MRPGRPIPCIHACGPALCLALVSACSAAPGPVSDPYDVACPMECHDGLKCGLQFSKNPFGTTEAVFACVSAGNLDSGDDCRLDKLGGDNCRVGAICTNASVPDQHFICRSF